MKNNTKFKSNYFCATCLFKTNYGHAFGVQKVQKVFGVQSCLMITQQFNQVPMSGRNTVTFRINNFKIFPIMLLRQLKQPFYIYCKGKTLLFFICSFFTRIPIINRYLLSIHEEPILKVFKRAQSLERVIVFDIS